MGFGRAGSVSAKIVNDGGAIAGDVARSSSATSRSPLADAPCFDSAQLFPLFPPSSPPVPWLRAPSTGVRREIGAELATIVGGRSVWVGFGHVQGQTWACSATLGLDRPPADLDAVRLMSACLVGLGQNGAGQDQI